MSRIIWPVIAILGLVGCIEASDTTGEDNTDTGTDTGARERITEAAYSRLCDEARELLVSQYSGNYYVQALCTAAAVEENTDAQSCGSDAQACIENPPAEIQAQIDSILAQADCSVINIAPSECDSPLNRLSACLDALDAEVASIQYTLTCAAAGSELDGWDIIDWPEECEQLESEC